jgi:hypothetical protein
LKDIITIQAQKVTSPQPVLIADFEAKTAAPIFP